MQPFALTVSPRKSRIICVAPVFPRRKAQPMRHSFAAVLCFVSLLASAAPRPNPAVAPVRVAAGTVLKFHLQTRLNPTAGDTFDSFPKGTVLEVRMLDSIDSAIDHDGAEFHGSLAAPLVLGGEVIIHSESEVRGLLALLRSKSHPEGFRYELLKSASRPRTSDSEWIITSPPKTSGAAS